MLLELKLAVYTERTPLMLRSSCVAERSDLCKPCHETSEKRNAAQMTGRRSGISLSHDFNDVRGPRESHRSSVHPNCHGRATTAMKATMRSGTAVVASEGRRLSYATTALNSCRDYRRTIHRRIGRRRVGYSRDIRRSCQNCCCRTRGPSSFRGSGLTDSRAAPA